MRNSPLTIDGLWYCLCPAFRTSNQLRPLHILRSVKAATRRSLSSASAAASTGTQHLIHRSRKIQTSKDDADTRKRPLSSWQKRFQADIQSLSVGDLESRLEHLSARKRTDIFQIVEILQVLLLKHQVSPTTRHYRAYILGNVHRRYGSSKNIRNLLHEMEREGVTADSATLHAAIEALAVHPDYLLRQEVIEALRARWLSLSPAGWHHLIVGLLHEGQYELALDRLSQMERKGIRLERWLHSLLVYKLCDAKEFDEVLHLLRSRTNKAEAISSTMWTYLLKAAIRASHFDAVKYIWTNAVDLGYTDLKSSDCREVLNLASEYGEISIAESVFRHLFSLQQRLDIEDYVNLLRVYARKGDTKTAFEIICQMHKSKLPLNSESIQPILLSLKDKTRDPATIWQEIRDLRKRKMEIPVILADLVIEYCASLFQRGALSASKAIEVAIDIYKDVFEVCTSGANLETYNELFALCYLTGRPDICTFFAKEMAALDVHPDQRTLETLILICADIGSWGSASKYLADLRARGWELSGAVTGQIENKCRDSEVDHAAMLSQLLKKK